jgi:hypothetical protein
MTGVHIIHFSGILDPAAIRTVDRPYLYIHQCLRRRVQRDAASSQEDRRVIPRRSWQRSTDTGQLRIVRESPDCPENLNRLFIGDKIQGDIISARNVCYLFTGQSRVYLLGRAGGLLPNESRKAFVWISLNSVFLPITSILALDFLLDGSNGKQYDSISFAMHRTPPTSRLSRTWSR